MAPGFPLALCLVWLCWGGRAAAELAIAASVHELGHLLAIYLLGGSLRRITLGPAGAEIEYADLHAPGKEALCAVAGPLAGLLLAIMAGWAGFRRLAGLSAFLSMFSLIPAPPLDGGRAYVLLLSRWLGWDRAERIGLVLASLVAGASLVLSAVLWVTTRSLVFVPTAVALTICCCKSAREGVISTM